MLRAISRLTALVSDDPAKLSELGNHHSITDCYSYNDYPRLLESGVVDAVYVAVPDHLHRIFGVMAAKAGRPVLCEKP